MTRTSFIAIAGTLTLLAAIPPAAAQDATDTDVKTFAVIGNVPLLCSGGTLAGSDGTFDLGVLVDTTTGYLRTDLTAPPKLLTGAFCTARSTISVVATPMGAENYTTTPPAGFSREIDYTATASGWTTTPATYDTAAATNAAASQVRNSAFTGDITVSVADFATTGGSNLRPVADTSYRGLVTVTLSAAE